MMMGGRDCYQGIAARVRVDKVTSLALLTARIKGLTNPVSPVKFLLQNRCNAVITRASCSELMEEEKEMCPCYIGSSPAEMKLA